MYKTPNVIMRTWQIEQQQEFNRLAKKWFTLAATPGSGKTTAMLNNAHKMLSTNRSNFIVIVVPTDTLKTQWKRKALKEFGLQMKSNFTGHVTHEYDGIIITYQQLAGSVGINALHDLHSYKEKVFFIFDEPHHMALGLAWGDAARYVTKQSIGGVLGTGTPFRSDDYRIPFVDYHSDTHELIPDYEYTYSDALIDRVVRAIFFRKINTEASWYSYKDELITASFYDELSEAQASERLNAAIHPDSDFVRHVLKQSYAELMRLRQTEQHNAKGLVICKSIYHAEAIARTFEEVNNKKPIIVTSYDEHGTKDDISIFGESDEPIIISVDMISEGVDIPPLRSLIYLTNKTTPLYVNQAIGRITRVEKDRELYNGYVYLPSDPRLLKLAHEIKKRRIHTIKYLNTVEDIDEPKSDIDEPKSVEDIDTPNVWTGIDEPKPIDDIPPKTHQERLFEIISATGIDDGGIYDAQEYASSEIEQATDFITKHQLRIPVETGAQLLRIWGAKQDTSPVVEIPTDIELKETALRKTANRLAYRYAIITNREPGDIHKHWVNDMGGKWQKYETTTGLESKIIWLKGLIDNAKGHNKNG